MSTVSSERTASIAVAAPSAASESKSESGRKSVPSRESGVTSREPSWRKSSSTRWERRLAARVAVSDTVALVAAMAAAAALVPLVEIPGAGGAHLAVVAVAAVAWLGTGLWARRRDRGLTVIGRVRYLPSITSAVVTFLALCVAVAVLGIAVPFALLIGPVVVGLGIGLAGRGYLRRWATRTHATGRGRRTVLLVGSASEVSSLGPALDAIGSAVEVLGACVTDEYAEAEILLDYEAHSKASVQTIDVLGSAEDLYEFAEQLGADTVLLASMRHAADVGLSGLAWRLDQIGTRLSILSSTNDIDDSRVQRETIGNATFVHIARPTYRGALAAAKRTTDVIVGSAMLLVFGIPMLVIAAAIRLSSRGSALFRQERVGLGGEHFTMFKFRSMVVDAEDRLAELETKQDAGNSVMFKMKDDPRVTAIGRLLRKTSLDELPQILNVLRGDMSLVGPRPPLPAELKQYDDLAQRRFLVKPGITGLWQVSGRSDLTWEQTVRYDRRYVENWSLGKDASILARTIRAMNKGAY